MSTDRKELKKVWPLVARVAVGALAGKGLLESQRTSPVQKVAPFTPSRKRHDDALGSGPAVEKTFHDDIDTGAGMADAAKVVGSALLGAYLGGKLGRKLGRGAGGLADALKRSARKSTHLTKQPSSGPPRPGLQWKPQTHRWIKGPANISYDEWKKPRGPANISYDEWKKRKAEPRPDRSTFREKTVGYQQATTWPQQKSIAGDIGSELGRTAGEAVGKKFSKQPSSGPPRPGLQWNPQTHRWVRGDKVQVPHKGRMTTGTVVRHDPSLFGSGGKGYVVDVGEYESKKVPEHKVRSVEGPPIPRQSPTSSRSVTRRHLLGGGRLGKQDNPFAIATSQAKEMGYTDFSDGSAGRRKRGEIAESIKEESAVSKLLKAVEGLKEGLIDGGQAGKPYTDSSKNIDTPKKKSELLPKDSKPPEEFMIKKECTCHE